MTAAGRNTSATALCMWLTIITDKSASRQNTNQRSNTIGGIPYVLASHNGIIAEVYEAEYWYRPDDIPERCMFDGKAAGDDVRRLFINKRLPKNYCKKAWHLRCSAMIGIRQMMKGAVLWICRDSTL